MHNYIPFTSEYIQLSSSIEFDKIYLRANEAATGTQHNLYFEIIFTHS